MIRNLLHHTTHKLLNNLVTITQMESGNLHFPVLSVLKKSAISPAKSSKLKKTETKKVLIDREVYKKPKVKKIDIRGHVESIPFPATMIIRSEVEHLRLT